MDKKREVIVRVGIVLVIMLSGLALVPFAELPTYALGWTLFANIYEPELAVNETTGAQGSIFTFTGSNYPGDSLATVYVDGTAFGTVMTDGSGMASFLIDTAGALPGIYNVTMEVDINASATQSIELVSDGVTVPPTDTPGPTFSIGNPIFLPTIFNN